MWFILLLLLVSLVSMGLGAAMVLFWAVPKAESFFIFRPTPEVAKTPLDFGMPFQQSFIRSEDGVELCLWHLLPEAPKASVVYFHGNSGNLGHYNGVFEQLYNEGFQVVAVDYRGYGHSQGRPSEQGLFSDVRAVVDHFNANLKIEGLPVIFWGRSLGGCFAAYAARHESPDGLILETTFPNQKSLLKHFSHFRAFHFFSKCRLDTIGFARNHSYPILVIHGDRDFTIPIDQGKSLYEQLNGPKEFYLVEGADHVNIHRFDPESYMSRIGNFIDRTRVRADS